MFVLFQHTEHTVSCSKFLSFTTRFHENWWIFKLTWLLIGPKCVWWRTIYPSASILNFIYDRRERERERRREKVLNKTFTTYFVQLLFNFTITGLMCITTVTRYSTSNRFLIRLCVTRNIVFVLPIERERGRDRKHNWSNKDYAKILIENEEDVYDDDGEEENFKLRAWEKRMCMKCIVKK